MMSHPYLSFISVRLNLEYNRIELTGVVEYPALDRSWPFQIDGWLRVNDDREIEAFDLVFRHFPWVSLIHMSCFE